MPIHFAFFFTFLFGKNYRAIALWPFIFIRESHLKNDVILINHEKIHLAQQIECLIIPFYIIYSTEYILNRIKNQSHDIAYRNISFEKEAYNNEKNLNYLPKRLHFINFKRTSNI